MLRFESGSQVIPCGTWKIKIAEQRRQREDRFGKGSDACFREAVTSVLLKIRGLSQRERLVQNLYLRSPVVNMSEIPQYFKLPYSRINLKFCKSLKDLLCEGSWQNEQSPYQESAASLTLLFIHQDLLSQWSSVLLSL